MSSPPIAISPSTPSAARFSAIRAGAAVLGERVGPRGAEDRAAAGQDAAHLGHPERPAVALERAAPAVAVADELVPAVFDALADDRPDHRVQPGAIAAAGEHADPHRRHFRRSTTQRNAVASS